MIPASRRCEGLDARGFEETLQKAVVALGHQGLLRQVVAPLAQTIGELWRAGAVTAAHEHFLTAGLKVFLGQLSGQFPVSAERSPHHHRHPGWTTARTWRRDC